MRGDPTQIDKATSERDRAAREQHREPDGWERDAREETKAEAEADTLMETLLDGMEQGRRHERERILSALSRLEQETAALWQEGTPATKAVAAYTAAVRRVVEGKT